MTDRRYALGDVLVLVDTRERTRARRDGTPGATALYESLVANVRGVVGVVARQLRASGDVIIARVDARTARPAAAVAAVDAAWVAAGVEPAALLAEPATQYAQPLQLVERKSLEDVAGSMTNTSDVPAPEHLGTQIAEATAFCRTTGARLALLVEGFQQASATGAPVGALTTEHVRNRLARIQFTTQATIAQTIDVAESAATLLTWADVIATTPVAPAAWAGVDDDEPPVLVRKRGANADARTWFTNVAMRTIDGLDDAADVVATALGGSAAAAVARLAAFASTSAAVAFIADLRAPSGARRRVGPAVASRVVARFRAVDDEESCGMGVKRRRR